MACNNDVFGPMWYSAYSNPQKKTSLTSPGSYHPFQWAFIKVSAESLLEDSFRNPCPTKTELLAEITEAFKHTSATLGLSDNGE